jgi:hypothetical protein
MISTFTGISFLRGTVKNDGGVILKSESVDEMVPVTVGLRCVLLMGSSKQADNFGPLSTHVENAWSSLPAEPKSVTAYLPKLR